MNRILIYSLLYSRGELPSHVLYTLEKLRPDFNRIIVVTDTAFDFDFQNRILGIADKLISRENLCFDYEAWKYALESEGLESIKGNDLLALMNDAFFGPLFDFSAILRQMESPEVDIWSIQNLKKSRKNKVDSLRVNEPGYRADFLFIKKHVLESEIFRKFWLSLSLREHNSKKIMDAVDRLLRLFLGAGFYYKPFFDARTINSDVYSEGRIRPDVLLWKEIPFLNADDLLNFAYPMYLKRLIGKTTHYPVQLIDNYFNKFYNPNQSIKVNDKNLILIGKPTHKISVNLRIAVHIHVFYIDVFETLILGFLNTGIDFELFVTTDQEQKKKDIISILKGRNMENCLREVFLYENRGRDVFPWLHISKHLEGYDIVGHFHTKKTDWTHKWVGESWMEGIINSMIRPLGDIAAYFENDDSVGIIIPDIPYNFKLISNYNYWGENIDKFYELWQRANCRKSLTIEKLNIPIMPFGNMFWYRPNALKPLIDMQLTAEEFPQEIIPKDGTLAHALERLPVYVAWSQGYDFRIAQNSNDMLSGFSFLINSSYSKRIDMVYNSTTWKIGSFFVFLPAKILLFLKSIFLARNAGK